MYFINTIEAFLAQSIRPNDESEINKATQIVEQLDSSISWLEFEASKQTDYQEKVQLQKERTAAEWERDRLIKEIKKVQK